MRRIGMVDRREQPALAEGFEQIDGLTHGQPLYGYLKAQAIVDRAARQLIGGLNAADQPRGSRRRQWPRRAALPDG